VRARRSIAAVLSASALMLTAGCGNKDNTKDESSGSPTVTASASPTKDATSSPEPSASASASADSALGTTVSIDLVKGKPARLLDDVKVAKGDRITVKAMSDEAHEIHIHGYDKMLALKPGEVDKVTFTADKTGSFLVEVEDTGFALFNIVVK
jgi:plastocyanin